MKNPIYLPLRDRMVLRHAADLLLADAAMILEGNSVDGVIVDARAKTEHVDLVATAKCLRRIARARVTEEQQ